MAKIEFSNQIIPIILNLIAAVFGAFGQFFYKIGASKIGVIPIYRNMPIFIGIIFFCLVMTFFILSFRLGGRLSIVYPIYATTFVWATLIAILLLKEPWSITQAFAVSFIVAGVVLLGIGATQQ